MGNWKRESFLVAGPGGTSTCIGFTYNGLGIDLRSPGSPKGRRKSIWVITHLGSGHRIGRLVGSNATVFEIATELAEAGDWSFEGLTGYQNQFPDAPQRWSELCAKYPDSISTGPLVGNSEDAARAVAMARAVLSPRPAVGAQTKEDL